MLYDSETFWLIWGSLLLFALVAVALGFYIQQRNRKRLGAPRLRDVREALRKEAVEAERALIQKHSPTPPTHRPAPPVQSQAQRPTPPSKP